MRMRGIDEGYKEIKACDPDTAITKTALRRMVTTGVIPSVKIGTKYLIDMDTLERYFQGDQIPPYRTAEGPEIRRIIV